MSETIEKTSSLEFDTLMNRPLINAKKSREENTEFDTSVKISTRITNTLRNLRERFSPPISSNEEAYDPALEVDNILKLPSSERPKALEVTKNRLSFFYRSMVDTQITLLESLNSNPDISMDELRSEIDSALGIYGEIPDVQKHKERALHNLELRRRAIDTLYNECDRDAEISEKLFGFNPASTVNIQRTPLGLVVDFESGEDYKKAFDSGESIVDTTGEYSPNGFVARTKIPQLTHAVALVAPEDVLKSNYEKAKKQYDVGILKRSPNLESFNRNSILEHEIQHVLNQLLLAEIPEHPESLESLLEDIKTQVGQYEGMHWEDVSTKFIALMKNYRKNDLHEIEKDEMFAMLREGDSLEEIRHDLSVIYQFDEQAQEVFKDVVTEKYGGATDLGFMARGVVEKVFGPEYREIVDKGLQAVAALRRADYSDEEIIFMCMFHPLEKWPKLVSRL